MWDERLVDDSMERKEDFAGEWLKLFVWDLMPSA